MKKPNSQPVKLGHQRNYSFFTPLWPHLRTERRIKALPLNQDGSQKFSEIHKTLTAQMEREKKGYDEWKSGTQMTPPTIDTKPTS
jgi:hypothetical protein